MNIKTNETNTQVIERMENGYDLMIEANNNQPEIKQDLVSKEERKVILQSIAKRVGKVNGEQLVEYIDILANGLAKLA